uniref:GG17115 n=1 Tax=Drosophila erecta TaxID=7220 RepID=B3P496_DROER
MADWRLNAFLIRTTSAEAPAEMGWWSRAAAKMAIKPQELKPKMPQLTGKRPLPVFMSLSGARHPRTSGARLSACQSNWVPHGSSSSSSRRSSSKSGRGNGSGIGIGSGRKSHARMATG